MTPAELKQFFDDNREKIIDNNIVYIKLSGKTVEEEKAKEFFVELIKESAGEDLLGNLEKIYNDENPKMKGVVRIQKIASRKVRVLLHARHIKKIYLLTSQELKGYVAEFFK